MLLGLQIIVIIFINNHFCGKVLYFASILFVKLYSFILLGMSYYAGLVRVGTSVLLIHDPADIVLHLTKLWYLNEILPSEIITNILFVTLCITWLLTRIIIYPYYGILGGWQSDCTLGHIATGFAVILYFLHLYWFKLIIQIAINKIRGGGPIKDVRSDDNEEKN